MKSADSRAKSAANDAISSAQEGQKEVMNFFLENSGQFLGSAAPGLGEAQEGITGLLGAPGESVNSYYSRYANTMGQIGNTAYAQLNQDRPKDVINSKSSKAFTNYLNNELDNYTSRLVGSTEMASNRLRELPDIAAKKYSEIAQDPTYNPLLDKNLKQAIQTPWVNSNLSSDALSAYKKAWTYNV